MLIHFNKEVFRINVRLIMENIYELKIKIFTFRGPLKVSECVLHKITAAYNLQTTRDEYSQSTHSVINS
jgi:hypothetical protein